MQEASYTSPLKILPRQKKVESQNGSRWIHTLKAMDA
jgi:hypothetical protein